jgi:hypothetical protein
VTQKEKKNKKGCANLAKKFLRKNDPNCHILEEKKPGIVIFRQ